MNRAYWLLAALGVGCATTPQVTPTFTYAPAPGTHFVRTVRLISETSIVGSPFRQRQETEFVWNVGFAREGEQTLVTQQLQRVALRINGAEVLDGERIPGSNLSVDLLVSYEPRVVEVRGADHAAEVLSALLRPGAAEDSQGLLTPDLVRQIAVARFEMVVRDVVGHPTAPGSTWTSPDPDQAVLSKTMIVDRFEPCGNSRCAHVSAQYEVNPQAAARRALGSAAVFLVRNGVNPAQTEVMDASLDYRDELLVEPATLVDHGATFSKTARVTFAGARGEPILVEFRNALEQTSTFP